MWRYCRFIGANINICSKVPNKTKEKNACTSVPSFRRGAYTKIFSNKKILKNLQLSKLYLQPLPYFVINEITYIVFSMFFFDRGEVFFLGILKIITFLTKFRISFVFLNILFTFVQNFKTKTI